jgi:hypothetical protein
MNNSPSRLSDDALAKMIVEARTTIRITARSTADVAERLSNFNRLYKALPTKPDTAALIYKERADSSLIWHPIGQRIVVGRSPKRSDDTSRLKLAIADPEMSREHFEIVLTNDGLYVLNDLNSLNGTYVDGVAQESGVLIAGSEVVAGKTTFVFTGQ